MKTKKKVLVGMSGGVDSSVAATILLDRGYDVYGATLRLWDAPDTCNPHTRTCCSLEDVEDARATAFKLGIPFYVLNMKEQFKELVVDYFVDSYLEGETPNPCIACNKHMKFSGMLIKALSLEMDYIATGHYARVAYDSKLGRYVLKKAVDLQRIRVTYFILNQYQLEHLILPLGDYKKTEVENCRRKGFGKCQKTDSQDICFVDTGNTC